MPPPQVFYAFCTTVGEIWKSIVYRVYCELYFPTMCTAEDKKKLSFWQET